MNPFAPPLRLLAALGLLAPACGAETSDRMFPAQATTVALPSDDGGSDDGDSSGDAGGDSTTGAPVDDAAEIDAYLLGLPPLAVDVAEPKHAIECDPNTMDCPAPWPEGELMCSLQYYAETKQIDHLVALQPDSPALWPGEIVGAAQLTEGFLSSVGLERAPAKFSISLENLDGSPSATMDQPSLSAFRDARNAILAQGLHGATPAQIAYEIHSVESRSELSIDVGASVDWPGVVDFDALFDFDEGDFSNSYLVDFTQTYYTVDLDAPARPSDLFAAEVTLADVQLVADEADPPLYVQSISYGRRVLFAMQSDASLEDIVAAIDAAIAGVAELDADVEAKDTLESAKITASIIGGDGDGAVKSILGVAELMQFITEGGNYSVDSPGAPIAYKVAYLDNAGARLSLSAVYPETVCE